MKLKFVSVSECFARFLIVASELEDDTDFVVEASEGVSLKRLKICIRDQFFQTSDLAFLLGRSGMSICKKPFKANMNAREKAEV